MSWLWQALRQSPQRRSAVNKPLVVVALNSSSIILSHINVSRWVQVVGTTDSAFIFANFNILVLLHFTQADADLILTGVLLMASVRLPGIAGGLVCCCYPCSLPSHIVCLQEKFNWRSISVQLASRWSRWCICLSQVKPPRLRESVVHFECKLLDTYDIKNKYVHPCSFTYLFCQSWLKMQCGSLFHPWYLGLWHKVFDALH